MVSCNKSHDFELNLKYCLLWSYSLLMVAQVQVLHQWYLKLKSVREKFKYMNKIKQRKVYVHSKVKILNNQNITYLFI